MDRFRYHPTRTPLRKLYSALGPGFITGAADDDPSGIATYAQTGALYGYQLLWTAVWQVPLLYYVQECVARIGAVRGKGLAAVLRDEYGWKRAAALSLLVIAANTMNAGADIGSVAQSAHLVLPVPVWTLCLATAALVLGLEIRVGYRRYAEILKFLGTVLWAYMITVFVVHEPWGTIARYTIVPRVSLTTSFLFLLVGTFGTTITAYCWFWQCDEEVEEEIADHAIGPDGKVDPSTLPAFLRRVRWDTAAGAAFAELIQWAIIVTCASVLWRHGVTHIHTAAQAASALQPLAGAYAKDLFAVGVLGVGLMAIPVFTGVSAYAVAELLNWHEGLWRKPGDARPFYAVIAVSTLLGLAMNFVGINIIKALVWTAVIWGLVAVPLLFAIAKLNSSQRALGERRGGRVSRSIVWVTFGVMTLAAVALIISWFGGL